MSNTLLQGKVSFVNHEKKYVLIEYEAAGKKKSIKGSIDEKAQTQSIKKLHIFHMGDVVNFTAKLSDRGHKMMATNIKYLYNTALDVLVNKAQTDNKFMGYLKIINDKYFVKEIETYLFFSIVLSPWQIKPSDKELNEAVTFFLKNIEHKEKITAQLYNNKYIPEFYTAVKWHKAKTPIDALVYKISAHGIYLNIVGDKIQAKISLTKNSDKNAWASDIKIGHKIKVLISYLSPTKIIVEEIK